MAMASQRSGNSDCVEFFRITSAPVMSARCQRDRDVDVTDGFKNKGSPILPKLMPRTRTGLRTGTTLKRRGGGGAGTLSETTLFAITSPPPPLPSDARATGCSGCTGCSGGEECGAEALLQMSPRMSASCGHDRMKFPVSGSIRDIGDGDDVVGVSISCEESDCALDILHLDDWPGVMPETALSDEPWIDGDQSASVTDANSRPTSILEQNILDSPIRGTADTVAKYTTCDECQSLTPSRQLCHIVTNYFRCVGCGWRKTWLTGTKEDPAGLQASQCSTCNGVWCDLCGPLPEARKLLHRDGSAASRRQVLNVFGDLVKSAQAKQRVAKTTMLLDVDEDSHKGVSVLSTIIPGSEPEGLPRLKALVVGSVIRGIVSQRPYNVCGAAATAGILNSCREGLPGIRRIGWKTVLYNHFRDRLNLDVEDKNGDPASWRIGRCHIKTVVESFPGMVCTELIALSDAANNRPAAWEKLIARLNRPRTTLFMHTKGRSGHYTLIAGVVGPSTSSNHLYKGSIKAPYRKSRVVRVAKGKVAPFGWTTGGFVRTVVRGSSIDMAGINDSRWRLVGVRIPASSEPHARRIVDFSAPRKRVARYLGDAKRSGYPYLLEFELKGSDSKAASQLPQPLLNRPLPGGGGMTRKMVHASMTYSPEHSAILTNSIGQLPIERMTFEHLCDLIVISNGFYRVMEMCCAAPGCYLRLAVNR